MEKASGREEVEVLGPTYEDGKPTGEETGRWSQKLTSRSEIIQYLQTGQRYFYTPFDKGFGSEKRDTPA
jgi:hypothetical protein